MKYKKEFIVILKVITLLAQWVAVVLFSIFVWLVAALFVK